jgi:hypothetical protein
MIKPTAPSFIKHTNALTLSLASDSHGPLDYSYWVEPEFIRGKQAFAIHSD